MRVSNRAIPTIVVVATAAAVLVTIAACQATPTATSVSVPPTVTSTIPLAATSTPTPTPTQPPTATPTSPADSAQSAGVCGQQGHTTVLLVGESLPEDRPARGASAIRLVRVDYDAGTVRVLSLPPYLWVETPALSVAGVDATALTLAYWEALDLGSGNDRARMADATGILSQTLAHNFGLAPDHTISIRQGAFIDAVNALGGLSINLPEDVDGSPSGFGTYRAGRQVLDGRAVLDYISIYPAVGDEPPLEWERLARQQQVLQALHAQLARPQTLLQLPGLARQFYQDVVTDLGLEQVLTLGCLFSQADVSIEFVELPADLATPGEDGILLPKTDEIITYLETAFAQ